MQLLSQYSLESSLKRPKDREQIIQHFSFAPEDFHEAWLVLTECQRHFRKEVRNVLPMKCISYSTYILIWYDNNIVKLLYSTGAYNVAYSISYTV